MCTKRQRSGIFLIPLAPGLEDTPELREEYFEKIINRFEDLTQQDVKKNIIFKESFVLMILKKTIIRTKEMLMEWPTAIANSIFETKTKK